MNSGKSSQPLQRPFRFDLFKEKSCDDPVRQAALLLKYPLDRKRAVGSDGGKENKGEKEKVKVKKIFNRDVEDVTPPIEWLVTSDSDRSGSINWGSADGDIMFHFNLRPSEGQIVMNSNILGM